MRGICARARHDVEKTEGAAHRLNRCTWVRLERCSMQMAGILHKRSNKRSRPRIWQILICAIMSGIVRCSFSSSWNGSVRMVICDTFNCNLLVSGESTSTFYLCHFNRLLSLRSLAIFCVAVVCFIIAIYACYAINAVDLLVCQPATVAGSKPKCTQKCWNFLLAALAQVKSASIKYRLEIGLNCVLLNGK